MTHRHPNAELHLENLREIGKYLNPAFRREIWDDSRLFPSNQAWTIHVVASPPLATCLEHSVLGGGTCASRRYCCAPFSIHSLSSCVSTNDRTFLCEKSWGKI